MYVAGGVLLLFRHPVTSDSLVTQVRITSEDKDVGTAMCLAVSFFLSIRV